MFDSSTEVTPVIALFPNDTDDWSVISPFNDMSGSPVVLSPTDVAFAFSNTSNAHTDSDLVLIDYLQGVNDFSSELNFLNKVISERATQPTKSKGIGGLAKTKDFSFEILYRLGFVLLSDYLKIIGRVVKVYLFNSLEIGITTDVDPVYVGRVNSVERGFSSMSIEVEDLITNSNGTIKGKESKNKDGDIEISDVLLGSTDEFVKLNKVEDFGKIRFVPDDSYDILDLYVGFKNKKDENEYYKINTKWFYDNDDYIQFRDLSILDVTLNRDIDASSELHTDWVEVIDYNIVAFNLSSEPTLVEGQRVYYSGNSLSNSLLFIDTYEEELDGSILLFHRFKVDDSFITPDMTSYIYDNGGTLKIGEIDYGIEYYLILSQSQIKRAMSKVSSYSSLEFFRANNAYVNAVYPARDSNFDDIFLFDTKSEPVVIEIDNEKMNILYVTTKIESPEIKRLFVQRAFDGSTIDLHSKGSIVKIYEGENKNKISYDINKNVQNIVSVSPFIIVSNVEGFLDRVKALNVSVNDSRDGFNTIGLDFDLPKAEGIIKNAYLKGNIKATLGRTSLGDPHHFALAVKVGFPSRDTWIEEEFPNNYMERNISLGFNKSYVDYYDKGYYLYPYHGLDSEYVASLKNIWKGSRSSLYYKHSLVQYDFDLTGLANIQTLKQSPEDYIMSLRGTYIFSYFDSFYEAWDDYDDFASKPLYLNFLVGKERVWECRNSNRTPVGSSGGEVLVNVGNPELQLKMEVDLKDIDVYAKVVPNLDSLEPTWTIDPADYTWLDNILGMMFFGDKSSILALCYVNGTEYKYLKFPIDRLTSQPYISETYLANRLADLTMQEEGQLAIDKDLGTQTGKGYHLYSDGSYDEIDIGNYVANMGVIYNTDPKTNYVLVDGKIFYNDGCIIRFNAGVIEIFDLKQSELSFGNPVNVIKKAFIDYANFSESDFADLTNVTLQRKFWKCGLLVQGEKSVNSIVDLIAKNHGLVVYERFDGKIDIKTLEPPSEDVVFNEIDDDDILVDGSNMVLDYDEDFLTLDYLINKIDVYYSKKGSKYTELIKSEFVDVQSYLDKSSSFSSQENRISLELDSVRNETTAQNLARVKMFYHYVPTRIIRASLTYKVFNWEMASWLKLDTTKIYESQGKIYLIIYKKVTLPFSEDAKIELKIYEYDQDNLALDIQEVPECLDEDWDEVIEFGEEDIQEVPNVD